MTAPTITALPTAPSRATDPVNFVSEADAFLGALGAFGTEVNALGTWMDSTATAVDASAATATTQAATATTQATAASASAASAANAPGTSADSTTSLLIGAGSKSLTITADKAFAVGQFVTIASKADPANYMAGQITAFTSSTGALTVSVSVPGGSGTFADWTIALSGPASSPDLVQTLTNKTINFASNTVTTTLAQLNTAISDGDVGTVTSVAALTLGTAGTDVSSSVANGTTTPVIALNIPTASAANRGALTAADWSTFNAKQAALVSGTNIKTVNGASILGSGDLVVGAGWTLLTTLTPTGVASIDATGIPATYSDLLIVIDGISHNNGSNTAINFAVSSNGTNFSTAIPCTSSGPASNLYNGAVIIAGYRLLVGSAQIGVTGATMTAPELETAFAFNDQAAWKLGAALSTLRFSCGAGNFDAGSFNIYAR